MQYRDKAREAHASLRAKRIKTTIYMDVYPTQEGGYMFCDTTWYFTYPHKLSRWIREADKERLNFIRHSHKIVTHNTLYYLQGITDYETAKRIVESYHVAKYINGSVSFYRLD